MTPDQEKPTVEALQKEIHNLNKYNWEQDSKIRAILDHLNVYIKEEVTMKRYTLVKQEGSSGTCISSGLSGLRG